MEQQIPHGSDPGIGEGIGISGLLPPTGLAFGLIGPDEDEFALEDPTPSPLTARFASSKPLSTVSTYVDSSMDWPPT